MGSDSKRPEGSIRPVAVARGYSLFGVLAVDAVAFHALYAYILAHGLTGHWAIAAVAVIAFSGIFAVSALIAVLTDTKWTGYALAGIVALSSLIVGFSLSVLIGSALEFLAIMLFVRTVQSEGMNRIRISLPHVMGYSSAIGITLGLLAVSSMAYQTLDQSVASGTFQTRVVDLGVSGFNRTAPVAIKGYRPSMTVDELIRTQLPTPSDLVRGLDLAKVPAATRSELERRLADEGIDPSKIDMDLVMRNTQLQQQLLVDQVSARYDELSADVIAATRERLSDAVGVVLDGNERVDDALRDVLSSRVQHFTIPQLRYVPLILTVTIFLTLILFNWLFSALAVLFARVGLAAGRHAGFIVDVKETVEVVRPALRGPR